jgi:hypothetical protein
MQAGDDAAVSAGADDVLAATECMATTEVALDLDSARAIVPATIEFYRAALPGEAWDYLHRLKKVYTCYNFKNSKQLLKPQPYTHICVLCLDMLSKRATVPAGAWESALFNMASVSNAKKHIMRRHPAVKFAKDEIEQATTRSELLIKKQDMQLQRISDKRQRTVGGPGAQRLITEAMRPTDELINAVVFRWLVEDGLPFHAATTAAFARMMRTASNNPSMAMLCRDRYNQFLDGEFSLFTKFVSRLLKEESSFALGYRFLTVIHDIWTSKNKDSIIGASVSFIDHEWRFRNVALLAEVKNDGQSAAAVARSIKERFTARYKMDVIALAKYTASDTANAARKVSEYFEDSEQADCSMHVLNLCIGYGLGMKEKTKTTSLYDPDAGCYQKVIAIHTPGGPFAEGATIIRKLRALNNHFSTGERRTKLAKVQQAHCYPTARPLIDVDVRVASSCRLMRRSLLNFAAYRAYFAASDSRAFDNITIDEWKLAAEMEAITSFISELALVEVQKSGLVASYVAVFRKMAEDGLTGASFKVCCVGEPPTERTTDDTQPRRVVLRSDLSRLGMVCVARTLAQLEERFPPLSPEMVMILLLDPRTKNCVTSIVKNMAKPGALAQCVKEGTQNLFDEHAALYEIQQRELRGLDEAPASGGFSSVLAVNLDMLQTPEAFILGAPVATTTKEDIQETRLREESDAIVNRWIAEEINWVKVANKQQETEDVVSPDFSNQLMVQDGGNAYWNLLGLYKHVDILRWFRDVGEKKYPSIALLARLWLGKAASTAFQERVFSTGGNVMDEKRTQTDRERAEKQLLLRHNRQEVAQMHARK